MSVKENFGLRAKLVVGSAKDSDGFEHTKRWHESAIKYLNEFGYLSTLRPTPRELQNAVKAFQDLIGVKSNGLLTQQTMELMMQPRCGNSDVSRSILERRKRFVYISRWENKNYTKDIPRPEIKQTVKKAFHLWSSQVKITSMESLTLIFEEANSEAEADITILWAEGDHGDAHKFDGPGLDGSNILAHTFYPNYQSKGTLNGDIHLDDYAIWHVNSSKEGPVFHMFWCMKLDILWDWDIPKTTSWLIFRAIMYPIYRKEQLDLMQLDLDDKCAINWNYVGASDLCLYIWLLSEVLPKKIAIEKDLTYMISTDATEWTSN
uniref:Peptidase metallopeptidase domain-containing protein n=1 Tax=Ditylenchus dipsaci TaxID=166011 RepID=A0A915DIT1_9BILA